MTLRTLNYGNYGIFLIMGNAGFCPSTVMEEVETVVGLLGSTVLIRVYGLGFRVTAYNTSQSLGLFRTPTAKSQTPPQT